jgi:site-specific DNA recombinase
VSGDIDLTTPDGQFQARILGAVAKKESDDKSRRIRRKHEELALNGKVSGSDSRPYDYEADKVTLRPAEAAIVQECAQRLLAGEPVRSIARNLK